MNEDKFKLRLGASGELKRLRTWHSYWVKPKGKFWKRFFNKKVRNGLQHKRGNWFEWS